VFGFDGHLLESGLAVLLAMHSHLEWVLGNLLDQAVLKSRHFTAAPHFPAREPGAVPVNCLEFGTPPCSAEQRVDHPAEPVLAPCAERVAHRAHQRLADRLLPGERHAHRVLGLLTDAPDAPHQQPGLAPLRRG
jgi:hypothetical protein